MSDPKLITTLLAQFHRPDTSKTSPAISLPFGAASWDTLTTSTVTEWIFIIIRLPVPVSLSV